MRRLDGYATIEIRSRNIKLPIPRNPQHLYIVLTQDADTNDPTRFILRAGPSDDNLLAGDLEVLHEGYSKNMKDNNAKLDWQDNPEEYRSVVIYEGLNIHAAMMMNKMAELADVIHKAKYDYKLPICDMLDISLTECNQQNSNAVVKQLVEYAQIPFKLPKWSDGKEVFAPGVNSKITHSNVDKTMKLAEESSTVVGFGFADIIASRDNSNSKKKVQDELNLAQKIASEAAEKAHNDQQEALRIQSEKALVEWNRQKAIEENKAIFQEFMYGYAMGRLESYSSSHIPKVYSPKPYVYSPNVDSRHLSVTHQDHGASISDSNYHPNIASRTLGIRTTGEDKDFNTGIYYYDSDTGLPLMGY